MRDNTGYFVREDAGCQGTARSISSLYLLLYPNNWIMPEA